MSLVHLQLNLQKKNSSILDKFYHIRNKPRSRILTPVKLILQTWPSHEISLRVFALQASRKEIVGRGGRSTWCLSQLGSYSEESALPVNVTPNLWGTKGCAGTQRSFQKHKIMYRHTEESAGTQRSFQGHRVVYRNTKGYIQGQNVMCEDRKESAGTQMWFQGHKERCGHTRWCWGT